MTVASISVCRLSGNPVCSSANQRNIASFCGGSNGGEDIPDESLEKPALLSCPPQICPVQGNFEYIPTLPDQCVCAAPFGVGVRLRSPSIYQFPPYLDLFKDFIISGIPLYRYQIHVDSISWESGPRLRMFLLFFPDHNKSTVFDASEVQAIATVFARFTIPGSDVFGPYDLLNFTAKGPYSNCMYALNAIS